MSGRGLRSLSQDGFSRFIILGAVQGQQPLTSAVSWRGSYWSRECRNSHEYWKTGNIQWTRSRHSEAETKQNHHQTSSSQTLSILTLYIKIQSDKVKICFKKLDINIYVETLWPKVTVLTEREGAQHKICNEVGSSEKLSESIHHLFSHFCICSFALINYKRCCCDV